MRKILFSLLLLLTGSPILNSVSAETFSWPTSGYIGWRYLDNGGNHNGIDIWSTSNGSWINNQYGNSNPVYAVYPGTVYWEGSNGFIVKHHNSLYTNYWHIRDNRVDAGNYVDNNTLIGYQDYDVNVHLHLTVSNSASEGTGHMDPSTYFNTQLNMNKPGVVAHGTYVSKGQGCGATNVTIMNQNISGSSNCYASNSITILPETTILGEHNYHL